MKPLPDTFRARGFDWRIRQREGDIAIVEQMAKGWQSPVLNVVLVQKHKARKLPNGEMTVDAEGIPSWEQYGDRAWVASDLADAKRRFNSLVDDANRAQTRYIEAKSLSGDTERVSTRGGFVSPPTPQKQPDCPLANRIQKYGDSRRDGNSTINL